MLVSLSYIFNAKFSQMTAIASLRNDFATMSQHLGSPIWGYGSRDRVQIYPISRGPFQCYLVSKCFQKIDIDFLQGQQGLVEERGNIAANEL